MITMIPSCARQLCVLRPGVPGQAPATTVPAARRAALPPGEAQRDLATNESAASSFAGHWGLPAAEATAPVAVNT